MREPRHDQGGLAFGPEALTPDSSPPVWACVVALDDRFYFPGEYKQVDFSCNTQFGAYCTQAIRSALTRELGLPANAVEFIDEGASAGSPDSLCRRLSNLRPRTVILIPCGRYRDATYQLIARVVASSLCQVSLLAGPCLPDDPAAILDRMPLLDGILLGDDFASLGEVIQSVVEGRAWRARITAVPGFAWRLGDGTISVLASTARPGSLGGLDRPVREPGLAVAAKRSERQSDRYGKWLIDSSIGCPRQCIYCRTPVISRRQGNSEWRPRSAASMVDEIESVVQSTGVSEFRFQDDNFIMPSPEGWQRCHEFASELRRRDLRVHFQIMFHSSVISLSTEGERSAAFDALEAVGLERTFIGVESGHDPTLLYYRKEATVATNEFALHWLSQRDLVVICGSVVFHPRTTMEQLLAEHAFFRRWVVRPRVAALSPLGSYTHIIPQSELESEVLKLGLSTRDEAEFRPVDNQAAKALQAMIELRRILFNYDWFLFTIKRDLVHWRRLNSSGEDPEAELQPLLSEAAALSVDWSLEVIRCAATDGPFRSSIQEANNVLFASATRLTETIGKTNLAGTWRASLYAKP